ncbi:unnamed protein product [Closterium sp. Yama58-4]|nr:unnamed protein product [Closterium sp. Yama58-4]
MEKSAILGRLVRVSGFQERLLADDLFFLKVFFECGVGMFTKTLAEYDRRKENFMKEINFVIADIVMALFADFMLVYLPAPTIALRAPAIIKGNKIASFFARCPDNAFQMALGGAKYSLLQRVGCVVRNGGKLMAVGTVSSLIGTGVTNALVAAGKKKEAAATGKEVVKGEGELPLVATSVAYGAYMAVSSNLRYQILAGVIEQRMLDPLLRNHKIVLSGASFCIRTLNTYLGSLLWVDYARLVGVQSHEAEAQAA